MIWMINSPTVYGYSVPTITKLAVICNCEIISVIHVRIHNLCLSSKFYGNIKLSKYMYVYRNDLICMIGM